MAPRTRSGATPTPASTTPSTPQSARVTKSSASSTSTAPQQIVETVWSNYVTKTPQRTKLIDAFLVFLMAVGVVQFAYAVVSGGYPFNAFLSGFSATVGQFVLTASLRIQTNPENEGEFKNISNERAFADYIFGSVLLHFFCVNFIN